MLNVVKRAAFGALLLIILPVAALLSGWFWQPSGDQLYLHIGYWITETSGYPWAILTCAVLALFFVWILKLQAKNGVLLVTLLAAAILSGQIIKSSIKESVEEPRPFVIWLEKEYHIDDVDFYNLPRDERAQTIKNELSNDARIPSWLKGHWQRETGYAFPSGHTLFATTWALIALVLLWPGRHYIAITLFMSWAVIVGASRLILGMHWPLDLILATILSFVIAIGVGWAALRYHIIPMSNWDDKK